MKTLFLELPVGGKFTSLRNTDDLWLQNRASAKLKQIAVEGRSAKRTPKRTPFDCYFLALPWVGALLTAFGIANAGGSTGVITWGSNARFTASREIQMFKVGLNYRFGSLFGRGYGGSY